MRPQVNTSIDDWKTTKWKDINVEQMDIDCKKFAKDVRSLDKEMKTWDAFVGLDNTVKNTITSLRAVSELQNPAIRDRHWQQLMQATQVPRKHRGRWGSKLSVPRLSPHCHHHETRQFPSRAEEGRVAGCGSALGAARASTSPAVDHSLGSTPHRLAKVAAPAHPGCPQGLGTVSVLPGPAAFQLRPHVEARLHRGSGSQARGSQFHEEFKYSKKPCLCEPRTAFSSSREHGLRADTPQFHPGALQIPGDKMHMVAWGSRQGSCHLLPPRAPAAQADPSQGTGCQGHRVQGHRVIGYRVTGSQIGA